MGKLLPLGFCVTHFFHLKHSNTISPKGWNFQPFFSPRQLGTASQRQGICTLQWPSFETSSWEVTNGHQLPPPELVSCCPNADHESNMDRIWNQCSFNQFAICAISAFLLPQLDFFEKSQVVWVSCYSSGDDISVVRSFKKRSECPTSSPRKLHLGRSTWGVSINNPGGKNNGGERVAMIHTLAVSSIQYCNICLEYCAIGTSPIIRHFLPGHPRGFAHIIRHPKYEK